MSNAPLSGGNALAIVSKVVFEKLAGKDAAPGQVLGIERYDSTHRALDVLGDSGALFLVTVRPPDERLFLVAVLERPKRDGAGWAAARNTTPILDLTPIRAALGFTAEPGKLAMSLQTPRALGEAAVRVLRKTMGDGADLRAADQAATVKEPPVNQAAAKETAKPERAPNEKPAKRAKPEKKTKPEKKAQEADAIEGSELFELLGDACIAQLEEVAAEVQEDSAPFLKAPKYTSASLGLRGPFTETVQSIFSGGVDAKEARRMLRDELAPFVDGPSLAVALNAVKPSDDADGYLGDLVDQFAIRAIDDLCRGLVALALDQPTRVPATCERYRALLDHRLDEARALIEGE